MQRTLMKTKSNSVGGVGEGEEDGEGVVLR